jgi:hypothetical protein
VSNVGLGEVVTHTTFVAEPTVAYQGLGELIHPRFVLRDATAEYYSSDHHFGGAAMQNRQSMQAKPKMLLRAIFQSQRSL